MPRPVRLSPSRLASIYREVAALSDSELLVLQLAERHRRSPADLARKEERIEAAVFKHSSIIAAMRAGAL